MNDLAKLASSVGGAGWDTQTHARLLRDLAQNLEAIAAAIEAEDVGPTTEELRSLPLNGVPALLSVEAQAGNDHGLLRLAEAFLELRTAMGTYLPLSKLSEPAWEILLRLFVRKLEGLQSSVTQICYSTLTPTTTALRHLNILEMEDLIERKPSENDLRVSLIDLTPKGRLLASSFLLSWEDALRRRGCGTLSG